MLKSEPKIIAILTF